jgi:hypothetical protein
MKKALRAKGENAERPTPNTQSRIKDSLASASFFIRDWALDVRRSAFSSSL